MKRTVLLMLGCGLFLTAQEQKLSILEQIAQPKMTFQSDFLSDAKFEGYEGSVKTYKQKIQINNEIVGFSYSRWDFDWKGENHLPFYQDKTPIDSMNRIKLYANWPLRINDAWFMLNSVNVNATYEEELSDAFGAGITSFFSYKVNNDHAIQLGAFANYHSVKTLALPVIGYSYRARETDGLKMVIGFPRAYIGYQISPEVLLNTGMVYSQAVIRLADDSGIEPGGYSEAKDFQANLGFRYEFNTHFELSADLLYAFKRDFTIYNHNVDEVDSYSIEPSLGGILKLKYLF